VRRIVPFGSETTRICRGDVRGCRSAASHNTAIWYDWRVRMSSRVMLFVLAIGGCGQSSGMTGDAASPQDMAAPDDDLANGSSTSDLANPANSGTINVTSFHSNSQSLYSAAASFVAGAVPSSPACTLTLIGDCQASACIVESGDAGTNGLPPTLVSAGTVTISGGSMTATMMPGANNIYQASDNTQALFSGNEKLTFATTGAAAPASSTFVIAPSSVTITKPAPAATYTITRASGFGLTWSGGGPGTVNVTIQSAITSTAPGTPYGSVRCQFPATNGAATVPPGALAVLPVGNASFQLAVANSVSTVVGDWLITANALTFPVTAAGAPFVSGQATVN
jgi:hypothetical protein